jgi:hypothetical protein
MGLQGHFKLVKKIFYVTKNECYDVDLCHG